MACIGGLGRLCDDWRGVAVGGPRATGTLALRPHPRRARRASRRGFAHQRGDLQRGGHPGAGLRISLDMMGSSPAFRRLARGSHAGCRRPRPPGHPLSGRRGTGKAASRCGWRISMARAQESASCSRTRPVRGPDSLSPRWWFSHQGSRYDPPGRASSTRSASTGCSAVSMGWRSSTRRRPT